MALALDLSRALPEPMGYMVRRDPTGPSVTVFRVGVADGDRIVRPGTGDPPPPPLPVTGDLDVLWGNGPPPDPTDPAVEPYESYVDLETGTVYVKN